MSPYRINAIPTGKRWGATSIVRAWREIVRRYHYIYPYEFGAWILAAGCLVILHGTMKFSPEVNWFARISFLLMALWTTRIVKTEPTKLL